VLSEATAASTARHHQPARVALLSRNCSEAIEVRYLLLQLVLQYQTRSSIILRVGQNHRYIRCIYGVFGREITIHTVIYGVYIQFWPTLIILHYSTPHHHSVVQSPTSCKYDEAHTEAIMFALQVHYAVAAVRAQLVNCNTGLAAPELLHMLRDSGTEVLVSVLRAAPSSVKNTPACLSNQDS